MECSRIRRRLSAFLDGEVSETERDSISDHLKLCEGCQRELLGLSQVWDFLDLMEETQASPYFMVHLKQKIAEQESRRGIRLPFVEWIGRVAAPAAATAVVLLSILFGSHLGRGIYQLKAENISTLDSELADLFGAASLADFSEGSLGSAYEDLLSGGGE